jgi:hypothetical protein
MESSPIPVPTVDICIGKEGCALLAVLILARVLYPEPEAIDVRLAHHDMQLDLLTAGQNQWPEGCDTVVAFGSDRSSVRMAELLLNLALEDHLDARRRELHPR